MENDKEQKRKDKVAQAIKDKKIVDDTSFTVFQIVEDLNERFDNEIQKVSEILSELIPKIKGDKGDSPTNEELLDLIEPLIPEPVIPENGKDYILTDQDKQEIAKSIRVPIVEKEIETIIEKTEVIRIEPLVTENVVEKAMYEEPNPIVDKINKATNLIDNNRIKGFSDLEKILKMNAFNPTMGPSFSDLKVINTRIDNLPSPGGFPGGSNTDIQFNDSGSFGGDAGFTYDKSSGVLGLKQNINFQISGSAHSINTTTPITADTAGEALNFNLASGTGTGAGGGMAINLGSGGIAGGGSDFIVTAGANGNGGLPGIISFIGGNAGVTDQDGGGFYVVGGNPNGAGLRGRMYLSTGTTGGIYAKLNTDSLNSTDRDFAFPDQSGTIALTSDITSSTLAQVSSVSDDTTKSLYTGTLNVPVEIRNTTEQFRLSYDATHYVSFTVDSNGYPTIESTGSNAIIYLKSRTGNQVFLRGSDDDDLFLYGGIGNANQPGTIQLGRSASGGGITMDSGVTNPIIFKVNSTTAATLNSTGLLLPTTYLLQFGTGDTDIAITKYGSQALQIVAGTVAGGLADLYLRNLWPQDNGSLGFTNRFIMNSPSDGIAKISNWAATGFTRLILGTNDTSGIAIKKNSTTFNFRLGDDSADTSIIASNAQFSGLIASSPVYTDASKNLTNTVPTTIASNYTPTATNVTNITSSTPNNATYSRVGSIVTVFGTITVTETLAVASQVDVSLPIASNLAAATDLNGLGNSDQAVASNIIIKGDATNDRASIYFTALSVGGNGIIYYSFQYKVI